MEQDITCKKEKELFFSYLGSLGLGALLLLLIAFLYFYNNYKKEKIYEAFGYLGTFGKNATKNFKLTLKSDTLLYEPLELIFPYKDTLSTPKTISSSIS